MHAGGHGLMAMSMISFFLLLCVIVFLFACVILFIWVYVACIVI